MPEPSPRVIDGERRLSVRSVVVTAAWGGLVSGWLEVMAIIARKRIFDSNRLYQISSDFVWVIPATNFLVFLFLGVAAAVVLVCSSGRAQRAILCVVCGLTVLPALLVAFPQVYGIAWLLVAAGAAVRVGPLLEKKASAVARLRRFTFPVLAALVPIVAVAPSVPLWLRQREEAQRPLPPAGSPNILLIVMDTVAADHLSLFGYGRPTSPTLKELSLRGIRFDAVQTASSWTLPSHASMFTGRWPHELSVGWRTPLDQARLTVAEHLGRRGYGTAGFIANTYYCAADSGLGRGFTDYRDYRKPGLCRLKLAVLVNRSLEGLKWVGDLLDNYLELSWLRTSVIEVSNWLGEDRKDAANVNREFLDWLIARPRPDRPFFAFLNYFDAHYPYRLPARRIHRFGTAPTDVHETQLIDDWFQLDKTRLTPRDKAIAVNAYDDCVAWIDEQLGRLVDELGHRGLLASTWVIIASDHGESFGEHRGVYCHGASLYQTELHVPLLILPPASRPLQSSVSETVSLRDLAATIVDLSGDRSKSHFPGTSLARFWDASPGATPTGGDHAIAEVVPNEFLDPDPAKSSEPGWPLGALKQNGWAFIRRERDGREELYHLRRDSNEQNNLAADPSQQAQLDSMRAELRQITAGPLTPQRFSP